MSEQISPIVCVVPGDDSAPEVVRPTVDILRALVPEIRFVEAISGREAQAEYGEAFPAVTKKAIDEADCTLFGASGGPSRPVLWYLRWGKETYVNIRPVRWLPGYQSPLSRPEQIDYVIVRDNLEGSYPPREGDISELRSLASSGSWWQPPTENDPAGSYAVRINTDVQIQRVAAYACEIALQRQEAGYPGLVTLGAKYSIQPKTDGRFRDLVKVEVAKHPSLSYQEYLIDDLARRLVATPEAFDVIVLNNEHGDILADLASGTIGGMGLSPSACYGEKYAYFEPVHGSAPDIAGQGVINPTAMLLSGVMLLRYFGYTGPADALEQAIRKIYAREEIVPVDQGGTAKTTDFINALKQELGL